MEWRQGDMLTIARKEGCAIAFTANGTLNSNGALVMGAGAAKRIRDAFEDVDIRLGRQIVRNRDYNVVWTRIEGTVIYAVQVKRHYNDHLDPSTKEACWELTERSLESLAELIGDSQVVLNCPLVGLGGFPHEVVSPMVETKLAGKNVIVCVL